MLTLIFTVLMLVIFGKIGIVAIEAAWGVTRIIVSIVLVPIALIAAVACGLVKLALPVLVIIGLVSLFTMPLRKASE